MSFSDKLLSCDQCWKTIFAEQDSFVGALSFEQLPNRPERMIRIHPCQNKHFMDQFRQSKNQLQSVLSVLLQPFFRLDTQLADNFTCLWINKLTDFDWKCSLYSRVPQMLQKKISQNRVTFGNFVPSFDWIIFELLLIKTE